MDMDCVKTPHFETQINNNSPNYPRVPREFILNSCTTDASRTYLIGKSPFPSLDMLYQVAYNAVSYVLVQACEKKDLASFISSFYCCFFSFLVNSFVRACKKKDLFLYVYLSNLKYFVILMIFFNLCI